MWTADRLRRSRATVRGFTLLEVTIAMVVISMMALVLERTMSSTQETNAYIKALGKAKDRCERATYSIFRDVSGARKVYGGDDVGESYRAALDLGDMVPAPAVRLPVFDTESPLVPDRKGDPRTGNMLLFVRERDPAVCTVDAQAEEFRHIDTYNFVCCYPHLSDRHVVTGDAKALDLVIWYSVGYASYTQIQAIEDADDRRKVVRALVQVHGITYAWDATCCAETAFYALYAAGHVAASPTEGYDIEEHADLSERGVLVYADTQLARTDRSSHVRRAVFTLKEPGGWEPNGFEVKVVGPSGHRKVWMRTTVEGQSGRGKPAAHASVLIASARDL